MISQIHSLYRQRLQLVIKLYYSMPPKKKKRLSSLHQLQPVIGNDYMRRTQPQIRESEDPGQI
jgi:hypothetical protein